MRRGRHGAGDGVLGVCTVTGDAHESKELCLKSIESIKKIATYAQVQENANAPA
ncbi:hypothetical protein [Kitasatospora sp. McL0602]|uniref:hypothetical protein n=1 Tax=Kitasatospora sp. McL0602 TaxID=3439530 RepID=UPI003F8B0F33